MQRWIKLPSGAYIDANKIVFVSKVETFPKLDDDGNDAGVGYSVYLGTGVSREQQINVQGSKEEILGLMKSVLNVTVS